MKSLRDRTFDELPALSVRKGALRQALRLTTVAQMLSVVWIACTGGSHVNVFARMLGFGSFEIGVLTAAPYIGNLGQLLASARIERTGIRKYLFLSSGVLHRGMWLLAAAAPLLLPVPSRAVVWCVLAVVIASYFFSSQMSPAWASWMGFVIPRRIRGRYFATRSLYGWPLQLISAVGLGVILDQATRAGLPQDAFPEQRTLLWVICGLFAVGSLVGILEVLVYWPIREVLPPANRPSSPPYRLDHLGPAPRGPLRRVAYAARAAGSFLRQMLIAPVAQDRMFRHYAGYCATIAFAGALPGMFLWIDAMQTLGFDNLSTNVLFLVINPVLGLLGVRAWGRLIDRWGRRPTLFLGTVIMMLSLLPWVCVTRDTPAPAWLTSACNWCFFHAGALFGKPHWFALTPNMPVGAYLAVSAGMMFAGIGWTGIGLAQMAVSLGFSEGRGRSKYIAATAVYSSLGGALGGLAGGLVASLLEYYQTHPVLVGPFAWNNCHATFVLSVVFRFAAILWLIRMPDPGSRPIRDLVRTPIHRFRRLRRFEGGKPPPV